jgi:uncharacterized protein
MKTKLLNLIIAIVFAVQSFAQSVPKSHEGLLWEVSGKGLKESSYVYGTYHLIGKSFTDTLPGLMKAFNASKTVVGEVVIEDDAAMAQKMMPFMTLSGKGLDEILSPDEFSEVNAIVTAKTGAPLSAYNGFKPAMVQLLLVLKIGSGDVSPENPSLDTYFQKEGAKNGKQVRGFETIEMQAALLLNTPLDKQKKDLLKTAREYERYTKESKELFEAYKLGNLAHIERAFAKNKDFTPEDVKTLITDRNKAWLKVLPDYLSKGNAFIAVGAGHLPGNEGVLALLRNAGYTVKPVSIK